MSSSAPYFKIVQTSNKGKFELCAIPSAWEQNGTLKWPPIDSKKSKAALKATAKLLEDANSVPRSDWREFKCVLKRTNIPTSEVAEAEIDVMMRESDTSCNESHTKRMPPPSTTSSRLPKRQVTTIVSNRNADSDRNNFNCLVCQNAFLLHSNFIFGSFCRFAGGRPDWQYHQRNSNANSN